jgi:hypothetical protein
MFEFLKKTKITQLAPTVSQQFITTLTRLFQILTKSGLNEHGMVIQTSLDKLKHNDIEGFIKSINSIDMWGGSGAVWEVYIEDKKEMKNFESEIIKLIDLMEDSKILERGIKPIRKIFKENLKRADN